MQLKSKFNFLKSLKKIQYTIKNHEINEPMELERYYFLNG